METISHFWQMAGSVLPITIYMNLTAWLAVSRITQFHVLSKARHICPYIEHTNSIESLSLDVFLWTLCTALRWRKKCRFLLFPWESVWCLEIAGDRQAFICILFVALTSRLRPLSLGDYRYVINLAGVSIHCGQITWFVRPFSL